MIKLSILICTLDRRKNDFFRLLDNLQAQPKYDEVEVLWLGDNKKRPVGRKRNDLLRLAQGDYIVFVDDDDTITEDYIRNLLEGIKLGVDVVVFDVMCSVNGSKFKRVIYDANYKRDQNLPTHYERMPNHIMCVRRELALKVMFPEKNFGEDQIYAFQLNQLLKTQARINKTMYYYIFDHQKSETQ